MGKPIEQEDCAGSTIGGDAAGDASGIDTTLNERGSRYGDFSDHADLAQKLQDIMRSWNPPSGGAILGGSGRGWAKLSAVQKQALTVIADKIARILSGDNYYADSWHDIQGYAKLAENRLESDRARSDLAKQLQMQMQADMYRNQATQLSGIDAAQKLG